MPRLSIIIPALGNSAALERTLVSVLENRPPACEVLVILNHSYADPYDLKDEVQFLRARDKAGQVECINEGLRAAKSPFIHLLACGLEASEGWTEPALAHFDTRRVAAVAPLVLDANDHKRVLAAGVSYEPSGVHRVESPSVSTDEPAVPTAVLGPCLAAAFYRATALSALGGALSMKVGDELVDVELALALKCAGFQAVCEPRARLFSCEPFERKRGGFKHALHAERLFWRNLPAAGGRLATWRHLLVVLGEFMTSLPRPRAVTQLLGRVAGAVQLGDTRQYHGWLRGLQSVPTPSSEGKPMVHRRIDPSHALQEAGAARGSKVSGQR